MVIHGTGTFFSLTFMGGNSLSDNYYDRNAFNLLLRPVSEPY